MGQVLHGCAATTEAVRRAIHASQASVRWLAAHHGITPETVQKWRYRASAVDAPMGPKQARSTALTATEEAMVVAFRRHTLLPLDDCLYALQPTIPHLTRSTLHRCLQRHGIARLPDAAAPKRGRFHAYPIGYFHVDIAEVHTEEGRLYPFVAVDRTPKFVYAELQERATRRVAAEFLDALGAGGAIPRAHGADRRRHAVRRPHAYRRVAARAGGPRGGRAWPRRPAQRLRPGAPFGAGTPSTRLVSAWASSTGSPSRRTRGQTGRSSA